MSFSTHKTKLFLSILSAVFCFAVYAANTVVGDLVFEQTGGKPVVEDLLRFNVRQQPGKNYDARVLDEDIKRLHELGYFADVTIMHFVESVPKSPKLSVYSN